MSFKDKIKSSLSGFKVTVATTADVFKNEYKKGQLKKELSALFETLGQVRYGEILDGGAPSEESARLCEEIARLKAEIKELEVKEEAENRCSSCKKKLPEDISYCPYCGTKQEEKDENEQGT